MYQNNHNRTRYGDPMVISPEWSGLPDNLDAFLHYFELKLTSNGPKLVDEYYFFKGEPIPPAICTVSWDGTEKRPEDCEEPGRGCTQ